MVNETQAVTKRATSSSVRQTFFKVEARGRDGRRFVVVVFFLEEGGLAGSHKSSYNSLEIALCLTVADAQNYAQIQPKEWWEWRLWQLLLFFDWVATVKSPNENKNITYNEYYNCNFI